MKNGKFRLNNRAEKALRKEVRKAQRETPVDAFPEVPIPTPIPRAPKKLLRGDLKLLQGAREKKKGFTKQSKRTNTGDVVATSAPEHVHPEGKRWIKTVERQEVAKNRRFSRRLTKQHIKVK